MKPSTVIRLAIILYEWAKFAAASANNADLVIFALFIIGTFIMIVYGD